MAMIVSESFVMSQTLRPSIRQHRAVSFCFGYGLSASVSFGIREDRAIRLTIESGGMAWPSRDLLAC
jgi:hypothetical protein